MPPLADSKPLAAKIGFWSLMNLTLLPGIGFLVMLSSFFRARQNADQAGLQAGKVSILLNGLAFLLLFGVSLTIWFGPWFDEAGKLALLVTYFTLVHSLFILTALWLWAKWGKAGEH